MIKQIKIGDSKFPNTWVVHRRRIRLIPGVVNEQGHLPVITAQNKRALCKMPGGFAGTQVGILNTSTTNIFDLYTGTLICHIFDPNFLPISDVYSEPKQANRTLAIVFGSNPHVEEIPSGKRSTIAEFIENHPATAIIKVQDHQRRIDLRNKLFGIGWRCKNRDFMLDGLRREDRNLHVHVTTPSFRKHFEGMTQQIRENAETLSSNFFIFGFDGALIRSEWIINAGSNPVTIKTNVFPFTWEELTPIDE